VTGRSGGGLHDEDRKIRLEDQRLGHTAEQRLADCGYAAVSAPTALVQAVALNTSAAHSGLMNVWSDAEWLTLQFGPVWVISALLGRSHFDELEQEAFWRAVEDAPIGESALPWQLMQAVTRNRDWLLDELILDDRSIITGLSQVASLLERVPLDVSRETREAILRVGSGMALARGPFGRRITDNDAQILELLGQLLESAEETAANNPLNSDVAL
jgi:hypothetical protein